MVLNRTLDLESDVGLNPGSAPYDLCDLVSASLGLSFLLCEVREVD